MRWVRLFLVDDNEARADFAQPLESALPTPWGIFVCTSDFGLPKIKFFRAKKFQKKTEPVAQSFEISMSRFE